MRKTEREIADETQILFWHLKQISLLSMVYFSFWILVQIDFTIYILVLDLLLLDFTVVNEKTLN